MTYELLASRVNVGRFHDQIRCLAGIRLDGLTKDDRNILDELCDRGVRSESAEIGRVVEVDDDGGGES